MSPFTDVRENTIGSLGENELIRLIREWLGQASPSAPYGIGDDCSVLPPTTSGANGLVTADPVIYGKHFDDKVSPQQAAAKLVRRNLSDIASMGGLPKHAVLSLALSQDVSISWIKSFYQVLSTEAAHFAFKLVGGDISSADHFLGAFLTLYGETIPGVPPLLRNKALLGSPLFVTGSLGGTRIQKHHTFTPRIAEGQWLARSGTCLSCTDLSDGIGKDYTNLIPEGLACQIDCSRLPIASDARQTARDSGLHPTHHALNDGEDFELFFALSPDSDIPSFLDEWKQTFDTPLAQIGTVATACNSSRLQLLNAPENLSTNGYEHLR